MSATSFNTARGCLRIIASVPEPDLDGDVIDPATMQSRLCPGLFLVGEMLDVDGRLGGFNFQWAWATGFVAGEALGR